MKTKPIVSAVVDLVRCKRSELRSFSKSVTMHPHFFALAALRAAGGSFADHRGGAALKRRRRQADHAATALSAALAFRGHGSASCSEGARPLDLFLLQLVQLPPPHTNDLLHGAVMDRLRVGLSEVVGLACHTKKASWAPHLPYVSCRPEELVCGGSGMSCGVGLGMRSRCGMPLITRGARRDAYWCSARVKSVTWWRENVSTDQDDSSSDQLVEKTLRP